LKTLHFNAENILPEVSCTRKYLQAGRIAENALPMIELCHGIYLKHRDLFKPVLRYRILEIRKKDPPGLKIYFHENSYFSGKGIFRLLKDSELAAVYVVTLGPEVDERIGLLEDEDFFEGYLLNAAAGSIIESLQAKARGIIAEEASRRQGFRLGKRFSPGYAGWDLSEQEKLLNILNGRELGLRLTEAFLMLPMKSASGVFGFLR
jgi:hypothetical protein